MAKQAPQSWRATWEELVASRDRARVRFHLLSREAQEKWHDLDGKIATLERRVAERGERLSTQTARALHDARDVVRDFVDKHVRPVARLADPVRGVMTTSVKTCRADDTLRCAAEIMWDQDCGIVPVVDDGNRLVGVVTDRDVCMAAYTQGAPLAVVKVSTAMASDIVTCGPDTSLAEVLGLMAEHQLRRIPAVETPERALVGVISLGDIAREIIGEQDGVDRNMAASTLSRTLAAISATRGSRRVAAR